MTENFSPVDAKGLANLLLDWADELGVSVSPMKLQKLVYYCHAEFLIATGSPLLAQEFEAWEYGPVLPGLFHEFKKHGGEAISSRATRFDPITATRMVAPVAGLGKYSEVVKVAFTSYARFSASTLSRMSHAENGPWNQALIEFIGGRNAGRKISNRLIALHHDRGPRDSLH